MYSEMSGYSPLRLPQMSVFYFHVPMGQWIYMYPEVSGPPPPTPPLHPPFVCLFDSGYTFFFRLPMGQSIIIHVP